MALIANDSNPANFNYGFQVKQELSTGSIDQLTQTNVNITALLVQESDKETKTIKGEIDLQKYREELYAGHVVKEELVIGPEVLQQPIAAVTLELISKETRADSTNKSEILSTVHVGDGCGFLNGEPPYCCPVCNKEWKDKNTVIQHIQTHASENSRCWVCEKIFISKFSLKRHLLVHSKYKLSGVPNISTMRAPTEGPPYNCSTCGKGFLINDYLRKHKKRHMINDGGKKPYSCEVCEKKYFYQTDLIRHMKTHTSEKPYSCSSCELKYSRQNELKNHMKIHTGEKPYSCSHCDKIYICQSALKKHIKTHDDRNPFCCAYCQKKFTYKYSLVVHILRLHSMKTPHSCGICGKRFKLRTALTHHTIGIHTKEYPYQCNVCNKGFVKNSCLKTHMKKHTGEKLYHCAVCRKEYFYQRDLNWHMKTHTVSITLQSDMEDMENDKS